MQVDVCILVHSNWNIILFVCIGRLCNLPCALEYPIKLMFAFFNPSRITKD